MVRKLDPLDYAPIFLYWWLWVPRESGVFRFLPVILLPDGWINANYWRSIREGNRVLRDSLGERQLTFPGMRQQLALRIVPPVAWPFEPYLAALVKTEHLFLLDGLKF